MNRNNYDDAIDNITRVCGYVVDKDTYDLQHINSFLKRDLAIAQDDDFYVGKKCYRVIHRAKRPCEFCNMHILKLGETREWYRNFKKSTKHMAVRESLQKIDDKICFIQSTHNITEDINQLLNLQNIANLDRAVRSCTKVLSEENDFKVSNEKLLKIVSEFYSADSAYIYEYDDINNTFNLSYTHYLDKSSHKVSKVLTLDEDMSIQLFNKNYVTLTQDEHGKNEYYKNLVGTDGGDIVISPIKTNDILSGLVGVNNYDGGVINYELISMLSSFVSNNLYIDATQSKLNSALDSMEETMGSNMVMIDCVKALLSDGYSNLGGSVQHLLSVIQNYYNSDRTYFFECDIENKKIKNINEYLKQGITTCKSTFKDVEFERLSDWLKHIGEAGHIYIKDCKTMVDSTTYEYKLVMKNNVNSIILIPLITDDKVCGIMGVENPIMNADDISLLKSVSTFVVSHMNKAAIVKNLEELSFNDDLTGLYNRNFYINYVEQLKSQSHKKMGIIFADVNGLKKANDNFGHEFGDILIKWSANFLRKNTGALMFRVGGDEFICFFENVTSTEFDFAIRRLQYEMDKLPRRVISFGSTWRETNTNIEEQIAETDLIMYKTKQNHYKLMRENPIDEEFDLEQLHELLLEFQDML